MKKAEKDRLFPVFESNKCGRQKKWDDDDADEKKKKKHIDEP